MKPLIVILTGAGISKESGLDTFRDKDGIWAKVRLEEVATPEGYDANPAKVHEFYNHRRRALKDPEVIPNPAHLALARLEEAWGEGLLLVTQNIDDLHERGGSRNLIHMHGELLKVRCTECDHVTFWDRDLSILHDCPKCGEHGSLRPDIVWFGELPYEMPRIERALSECDLFLSIGTSGNVYPAAGFVRLANAGGARTVELNLEPSKGASLFEETIYGPASETVPAYVEALLRGDIL